MSSSNLPAEFAALPDDVRHRILAEGLEVGARVVQHAVQILLGPKQGDPASVNHGSGVQILIGSHRYLATAAHVIRKFEERTSSGEDIIAQVGNALVPVLERIAWWDENVDIALLRLEPSETQRIPSLCWIAEAWPPPVLVEGDFVAFAGYPSRYRQNLGPGRIDLPAIGGLLRVESASDRRLTSIVERDQLVLAKGHEIPPTDRLLGGMSGGPVFRVEGGRIALAGLFKENAETFEAQFYAPLATVADFDPEQRIAI